MARQPPRGGVASRGRHRPEHLQKVPRFVEPRGEAKIAHKAKVSRQAVRNILRGETWIDLPTLYRIEKSLGHKLWIRDY